MKEGFVFVFTLVLSFSFSMFENQNNIQSNIWAECTRCSTCVTPCDTLIGAISKDRCISEMCALFNPKCSNYQLVQTKAEEHVFGFVGGRTEENVQNVFRFYLWLCLRVSDEFDTRACLISPRKQQFKWFPRPLVFGQCSDAHVH